MKVSNADLKKIVDAIAPLDTKAARDAHLTSYGKGELRCKDANVRYRWDLYWAAVHRGLSFGHYDYSDAHIDTALRRAIPPLIEG
jgi:hypothetical protein